MSFLTKERNINKMEEKPKVYHYKTKHMPPTNYMNDLDRFMEKAQDNYFTLHIENTSVQYLPVVCEGYIKVTKENEEEMKEYVDIESTYWKTRQGALMIFSDEIGRTIPMFVANASMPFNLTKKETGNCFNTMNYRPELNIKRPDNL